MLGLTLTLSLTLASPCYVGPTLALTLSLTLTLASLYQTLLYRGRGGGQAHERQLALTLTWLPHEVTARVVADLKRNLEAIRVRIRGMLPTL